MSIRIVHIGDVHLQAGHPRNATRLQSLDQIIKAEAGRTALWLMPGDLFHTKSTAADRNDLAWRLALMAESAPVVIVRGNHDQPGDLDIFERLDVLHPIKVVTRPCVLDVVLPTGDRAAIACVPYPDKAWLVAAGVAKDAVPQTAADLLDVIFMSLAGELATARASGALPLFCGHFNVKGAIASTGQPQIGQEQEVDRLSLQRLDVLYCALNHIHKAQEVGVGVYAGSIAPNDFGEVEEKSYVVVEVSRPTAGMTTVDTSRVRLNTPRLVHVNGRLTPEGFFANQDAPLCERCDGRGAEPYPVAGDEDIDPLPCYSCRGDGRRHDWTGLEVRVRYTYKASEKALLDEERVRANFAGALRLKIEAVVEPDRDIRSPEVAAATTLEGKLTAFLGGALAIGVREKLTALQSVDGDQVLRDVTARLGEIETAEKSEAAA